MSSMHPHDGRTAFLADVRDSLGDIFDQVDSAASVPLDSFDPEDTALIVVDMVNGFVKSGALSSPNALAINGTVARLAADFENAGFPVVCLCDTHRPDSPEFAFYPPHCVEGTEEPELTAEIEAACPSCVRIAKNSTNGLLQPEVLEWVAGSGAHAFVVCGVCTDICVQQMALSLKTYFNTRGETSRIVVPTDAVATYDLGPHDSRLTGLMALYNMSINGIELCREITRDI